MGRERTPPQPKPLAADRYDRQRRLPEIGDTGQEKLASSTALIVGCGALGSVQAELLARAGIGRLRLVDRDLVELSNLQRQFLFDEPDAREHRPKAEAMARHLKKINGDLDYDARVVDLNSRNILSVLDGVDLVLDGSDNFEIRYVINDACISRQIDWIYGGAVASSGVVMPILADQGPCLRCLLPEPPATGSQPSCDVVGVLGPLTAMVASLQTMHALRILVGDRSAAGQLTTIDLWPQNLISHRVPRSSSCPCCAEKNYPFLDNQQTTLVTTLCGRNAVQFLSPTPVEIDLRLLAQRSAKTWTCRDRGTFVEICDHKLVAQVFGDARIIIQGTTDVTAARVLRDRILGA